ncbi:MAG: hypothetical protein HC915_10930, partial [Anaerolineae bacterium]|nr:hypothetical protein [Anaerolineae bacterium]
MPRQRDRHIITCEVCGATQYIDLSRYHGKAINCSTCAAPLPVQALLERLHPESGTPAMVVNFESAGWTRIPHPPGPPARGRRRLESCLGLLIALVAIIGGLAVVVFTSVDLGTLGDSLGDSLGGLLPAEQKQPDQRLPAHSDRLTALAYSPDGQFLATGGGDATIRLYALASGAVLVLRGHTSEVRDLAYAPDGGLLVSVSRDEVLAWSMPGGEPLAQPYANDAYFNPSAVAFSADGALLAIVDLDTSVWDLSTGQVRFTVEDTASVEDAAFSPDGSTLATSVCLGNAALDDGNAACCNRASPTGRARMCGWPL